MLAVHFPFSGFSCGVGNAEPKLIIGKAIHQHFDQRALTNAARTAKDYRLWMLRHDRGNGWTSKMQMNAGVDARFSILDDRKMQMNAADVDAR